MPFPPLPVRPLAAAVLAAALAALCVWIWKTYRRMGYKPLQFPIYVYNLVMTRIRWRARLEGALPIDPPGGAVIVCNHRSPVDPAFVALAARRQVHWMVAREYCQVPVIGWGLRVLEVIPTSRAGIDTAATRAAVRYAQRGELVGMFPEGRLNTTTEFMLPGRLGAALVALRARVPVIPCYIEGGPFEGSVYSFFWLTARARLVVGRPLDLSPYYGREGQREVLEHVTRWMMREIALLAGRGDFQPQIAGKPWKPAPREAMVTGDVA
ncbi:MAG: 1-acyl-sn-glycerol-3-phosphate acyltransferase [Pirellulales bacterium]|nr:1-acyl-sn-glycerol-3-phosphate acyltransferase [Pirellulales bacterium]